MYHVTIILYHVIIICISRDISGVPTKERCQFRGFKLLPGTIYTQRCNIGAILSQHLSLRFLTRH